MADWLYDWLYHWLTVSLSLFAFLRIPILSFVHLCKWRPNINFYPGSHRSHWDMLSVSTTPTRFEFLCPIDWILQHKVNRSCCCKLTEYVDSFMVDGGRTKVFIFHLNNSGRNIPPATPHDVFGKPVQRTKNRFIWTDPWRNTPTTPPSEFGKPVQRTKNRWISRDPGTTPTLNSDGYQSIYNATTLHILCSSMNLATQRHLSQAIECITPQEFPIANRSKSLPESLP